MGERPRAATYSKVVDIQGAQMQHAWLHCPSAPMDQRSLPEDNADEARRHEIYDAAEEFKGHWAFDRKESGLGTATTSSVPRRKCVS